MVRYVFGNTRGTISVLTALVLTVVVGISALAVEFGHGLLTQVENQRIADFAAYAGALIYNSTSTASTANSVVLNVASLNGLSSGASSSVVSSPTGDGNNAVEVTVTTSVPLLLAQVLGTKSTLPVSATAYAEINPSSPGCIIALSSGGNGISLSGTGSITADNCAVASNSTVCADSGANSSDVITTQYLSYASGSSPKSSKCTISPPSGTASVSISKSTTSDPLAGNSAVSTATSHLGLNSSGACAGTSGTVCALSSPSAPTVPTGGAVSFPTTGTPTGLPSACSAVWASGSKSYTVTCTGTATFGTITLGKSVSVTINTSSGNTYNFNQSWPISGVTLTGSGGTYGFGAGISTSGTTSFPAGTYNIVGGITTGGGSTTTFGAGIYNIGTASCNGTAGYSICNLGSSLTFTGADTFVLAGGIYNKGGASMALGSGSSNSYEIGKASDGYSINVGTSQIMSFGDATGSGDVFETAGTISSGGGSCLALPAATEHDINGNISSGGGVVLGAGIYTVNGYINFAGGGGDVSNCPTSGTTTGLTGLGVTLVVSGASTVTCNSITAAFCLGSGFSTVKLTAPSSGSTANLAVIGPQSSSNTAGASFQNGASNTRISGAFYFPNGQIYMSGSATLQDTVDSGACLELIGTQITSTAGSALGSTCTGLGSGSSSGTTVSLVQ